jgi:hypothetical protein
MSIDLLHRMNHSERQYRRGVGVTDEVYNESELGEEGEIAIRKRGGSQGSDYGDSYVMYYARDRYGGSKPVFILAGDLIDQFKEP